MTYIRRLDSNNLTNQQKLELNRLLVDTFSPHRFSIRENNPREAHFASVSMGTSSIAEMSFFSRTQVKAAYLGVYYILFIKRGFINCRIDGREYTVKAREGIILSPGQSYFRESGGEGVDIINVKFIPSQINKYLPFDVSPEENASLLFDPFFNYSSVEGGAMFRAVEFVRNELLRLEQSDRVKTAMTSNYEYFLIKTFLDCMVLNRCNNTIYNEDKYVELPSLIKKAVTYIETCPHRDIRIEKLCEITNTKKRTLYSAFKKYFNMAPMQYLKKIRLDKTHEELTRAGKGTTVTDVAQRWGFNQLGWFSKEYYNQFGEKPSQTLKKSKL